MQVCETHCHSRDIRLCMCAASHCKIRTFMSSQPHTLVTTQKNGEWGRRIDDDGDNRI